MFTDLKDKRVLITGSTAGIGLATAQTFARYGARIGITSTTTTDAVRQSLETLRQIGGEAEFFQGDLCQSQECKELIERFVARFGGIDVVINNVGGLVGRKQINATIPMGRFATAQEVAPTFLFLASHACSGYITGQIINVKTNIQAAPRLIYGPPTVTAVRRREQDSPFFLRHELRTPTTVSQQWGAVRR